MIANSLYDPEFLSRADRAHHLHPWTDLETLGTREPIVIAEAEGVHIHDIDGNRLLDGIGGMWCVNIGYGRREMAQAIADQAARMCYYSPFGPLASPPAVELSARLARSAPGDLKRVFFTTGGSTAADAALRFAQYYFNFIGQPTKKHIITRENAYHGSTFLSASVSGKPGDRAFMELLTDRVHHLPSPNPYRRPDGMSVEEFCDAKVADLEAKIVELGPENVACFIAEPLLASGGVIVPPPGYQRRTFEVCRKYDVLYISDEVVTGFGRLGHIFASEPVFGVTPDLLLCAKGLTSGYVPLGAVLISEALIDRISGVHAKGKLLSIGFTYSGHPVSCAAALTNIDIIEREGLCAHASESGAYFQKRLRSLADLELVGDVRGMGMMACVECVRDRTMREAPPSDWEVGRRIFENARARGLLARPMGHLIVLSPPLIITTAQIDRLVEILREAVIATMDELVREGLWRGESRSTASALRPSAVS